MSTRRELDLAYAALAATVGRYLNGNASYRDLGHAFDEVRALQTNLDGDAPANATDTSIAAAKTLPGGAIRRKVLSTIYLHHQMMGTGMTTDAVERRLDRPHTSVSSAVNYLASHGLLEDSGARANTRQGRKAIMWKTTELADQFMLQEAARLVQ